MKLFNKKIMLTLLFSFATLSFSNDGAAFKNLEKQLAKREKIEKTISNMNAENKDIVQQNIKTKLSILSGKSAAAENISTEFNYYKNSVYEIFAKPNYITTLKLNSDENLVYVGGGDVENWQIDETNGGSENATYLMIKPSFPNLKTNLSVITDKRSYFIVLESTDNSYNPYVSWKYPYDEGMAHIKKIQEKTKSKDIELNAKEINQIEFGYTYNKNSKIAPEQVCTDGEKTVLIFNDKLQESPVVYVYGDDNTLSLVNYRQINNKVIIDKVVDKIQLVLGKEVLEIKK